MPTIRNRRCRPENRPRHAHGRRKCSKFLDVSATTFIPAGNDFAHTHGDVASDVSKCFVLQSISVLYARSCCVESVSIQPKTAMMCDIDSTRITHRDLHRTAGGGLAIRARREYGRYRCWLSAE